MDVEKINFRKLFRDIRAHVDVGLKLYRAQRKEDDATFYEIFLKYQSLLEQVQSHQEYLSSRVSKYDFVNSDGSHVKFNGYRNVVYFISCVLHPVHQSLQKAAKERSGFRFSASEHIESLYMHYQALQGVERFACYSCKLMEAYPPPHLFGSGDVCQQIIRASIRDYFSRDLFYGRLMGLQFAPNMKPVLKMLGIGMASYEEWHRADKDEPVRQILASLWKGSRYLKSPTRLGLKLESLTVDCSIQFVKAFWSLAEQNTFQGAVKLLGQSIEVRQFLEVPAKPIKVSTKSGGEIEVSPPSVYTGYKPIKLFLISYKWRGSQPLGHDTKKQSAPLSPGLLVHFHGGGYVAQTPQAHEYYLRQWSYELDVPIVSIDYSLAPEAPFPRALEECTMAYSWILQNLELLGSTGDRIIFAGDSSGGNLALTTTMKLKKLDLRLPDALLIVYPSTNVTSQVSPSRVMSMIDPILPLGVMIACQQAYSNQLPAPQELSLHKEYRSKIMKAQGYYLPDPDAKNPSWKEKRPKSLRKGAKSTSASKEEDSEMVSLSSKSNKKEELSDSTPVPSATPPKRPPPPFTKVDIEAASVELQVQDSDESTSAAMENIPLDVDPLELKDSSTTSGDGYEISNGYSEILSKIPICYKKKPEESDKLSPAEIDELIDEVAKSFENGNVTEDPFMSPLLAPDELLSGLPPVHIIGAAWDSVLDDSISMAQKLKSLNQPVTLDVANNLPHAFLSLISIGNNADMNAAHKLCLDHMKQELQQK